MKQIFYLLALLSLSCAVSKNKRHTIPDSHSLISQMHSKSKGHWVQTFTFVQTTFRYQQDGTIDTSSWYETISYPDKFRIDFGEPSQGNGIIFRNDSAYQFREFELISARYEVNDLLLLTGAEQIYPVDSTLARLKRSGVETGLFRVDTFMGKPCYVIGERKAADPKSKEVWIEQNRLLMTRQIESAQDGKILEIQFDEYTEVQDSWIEQWVTIYYDHKLLQSERYNHITVRNNLPAGIFDPAAFGKVHWYNTSISPKITFDISKIDKDGLSGTSGGKVAIDYEFCIPAEGKFADEVKRIDPGVKVLPRAKGRIGCGKSQWLCMGNTHQKNWRAILDQLVVLDYISQIDQTFFE